MILNDATFARRCSGLLFQPVTRRVRCDTSRQTEAMPRGGLDPGAVQGQPDRPGGTARRMGSMGGSKVAVSDEEYDGKTRRLVTKMATLRHAVVEILRRGGYAVLEAVWSAVRSADIGGDPDDVRDAIHTSSSVRHRGAEIDMDIASAKSGFRVRMVG